MKFTLRIVLLLLLITGTLAQDGFDLSDALDDPEPTPKPAEKPKAGGVPTKKPKKPSPDFDGFDLGDALHPGPATDKPAVKPPKSGGGGGGGSFDDSDLFDVGQGGDYKPDGGRSGGRAQDPNAGHQGGADQPQAEGASSPLAGIISAVVVAVVGAGSSYFAYQKKKLCFKMQGGQDPESGKGQQQGTHSEPQAFSTLLQSS